MKSYNKIVGVVIMAISIVVTGVNGWLFMLSHEDGGRPYLVEINRIVLAMEERGLEGIDLSEYDYVTHVERYGGEDFYNTASDYVVREIEGVLYRFDYSMQTEPVQTRTIWIVNLALGLMALLVVTVLIYIRQKVLRPFEQLAEVPCELAKGNLTLPLPENKSRFFGRFIWGVDLLREHMEQQKQRELDLQREKKLLLLSLSHDIKTPVSAIKLYAKVLTKGLYSDREQWVGIAESIDGKADEIEGFVSEIIKASREDFLSLEVHMGECYLSGLIGKISHYYEEKLALVRTEFSIETYPDCLLKADMDRSVEVLQNIMENAIKYGDGREIGICISEEENYLLLAVRNSGCSLTEPELPHMFESFWRGSNTGNQAGSGLGLYICRQLMHKMGGEVFAERKEDGMTVTTVFEKA